MSIKVSRFILVVALVITVNIVLIISVSGFNTARVKTENFNYLTLKNGDLIFRNGNGLISDWFQRCSLQDPSFSHVGLVVIHKGKPFVVHLQQQTGESALKIEALSDFWDTSVCSKGAVYRSDLKESQIKSMLVSIMDDLKSMPEFDHEFSLNDEKKYYCSEWIMRKFSEASGNRNYFPLTRVDDFMYIAPDNLYLNRHTSIVYSFNRQ